MVFAHGIGGAKDLPIPAEYAIAGAGAALAVSFIVLALAWRTPALRRRAGGVPLPGGLRSLVDGRAFAVALRVLGLRSSCTSAGRPSPDRTCWSTRPSASSTCCSGSASCRPRCCSGRSTGRSARCARSTSLFTRLTGGDPEDGLVDAAALGRAVARGARPVRLRVARAGLPRLDVPRPGAAVVRGLHRGRGRRRRGVRERWIAHADPFEVYSTLVGHLSVFGRRRTARWCCAARWATSTACRRCRDWSAWSRCCSAAPPSTASRTPTSG